jgi:hypothetical protein
MKRRWKWVLGAVLALAVVAALTNPDDETADPQAADPAPAAQAAAPSECMRAFEQAASVGEMQDTVSDLYPAALACGTLAEWAAASEAHPAALDGADPETFAGNMCLSAPPEVRAGALCAPIIEARIADDPRVAEMLERMDAERGEP